MKLSDIGRLWLHIPIGMATILGVWVHWGVGLIMCLTFLFYEYNEDEHLGDMAWKDVVGYSWGLFMGMIVWAVIRSVI